MSKNENCAVSDSSLCRWLNKDCSVCQIQGFKHEGDAKKALEDFEITLELLPEDFDELQGDECQLCKGEKHKKSGYALIDLGHEEPKSEVGMFFGFGKKVRRKIGSLMPLSISVCKKCRAAFRTAGLIKWAVAAVITAIAIVILAVTPLGSSFEEGYGLLIAVAAALIGYAAGRAVGASYVKSRSKDVRFNVFEIPVCAKMRDMGWFTVQDETPVTRYIFSRKSMTKKLSAIKENEDSGQPV